MVVAVIQWLLVSMAGAVHPFYISMTDIKHNAASKTVEVSVRIYADDFEETLRKACNCKIELLKPVNKTAMDKAIQDYIVRKLQIKVNGQATTLQYAGFQQEESSIWSYFEIKEVQTIKKLDISNTLLHDYKQEQINMVHVKANGTTRSDKLDYPHQNLTFSY